MRRPLLHLPQCRYGSDLRTTICCTIKNYQLNCETTQLLPGIGPEKWSRLDTGKLISLCFFLCFLRIILCDGDKWIAVVKAKTSWFWKEKMFTTFLTVIFCVIMIYPIYWKYNRQEYGVLGRVVSILCYQLVGHETVCHFTLSFQAKSV